MDTLLYKDGWMVGCIVSSGCTVNQQINRRTTGGASARWTLVILTVLVRIVLVKVAVSPIQTCVLNVIGICLTIAALFALFSPSPLFMYLRKCSHAKQLW